MINRVKKLKQQVNIEPLVWNPKKGKCWLVITMGMITIKKAFHCCYFEIDTVLFIGLVWTKELTEQIFAWGAKIIPHDDLISIQFLGVEKDQYGKKNNVYKFVIDRALNAGKDSNAITISTLDA
jgi:hypothetical protein